jgi:hypothetical protein
MQIRAPTMNTDENQRQGFGEKGETHDKALRKIATFNKTAKQNPDYKAGWFKPWQEWPKLLQPSTLKPYPKQKRAGTENIRIHEVYVYKQASWDPGLR